MMRAVPILVFLVFVVIAAVLLLHKKPASMEVAPYPLPALRIHALQDVHAAFALDKSTHLINFFASWCAPCIAEHSELVALKKQFPSVTFHGIAWNDTSENIETLLKTHGNPYHHLWLDSSGKAAIALGLRGVPESFIVREGKVIYRLSGAIDASNRQTIMGILRE